MALSAEAVQFFKEVANKSLPNANRPQLSPELEAKFKDLDARSAVCYQEMEVDTERLRQLAKSMKQMAADMDTPDPDAVSDGAPVEELFDSTSTVVHIEEMRTVLRGNK